MRASKRHASVFLAGLLAGCCAFNAAVAQEAGSTSGPPKTAKERQAGKAYDPQRVNDCKVPLELRDDKTRSADCGEKAKAAAGRSEGTAAEESSD